MKTRYLLIPLTILFLLITQSAITQVPMLEWAAQMGGINIDKGKSITVDASGNVYTVGHFQATADFDPGSDTYIIDADEWFGNFIQKLDADGNLLWAKQIGQSVGIEWNSIAVDALGNSYIAGSFNETIDFDPGPDTFNLTGTGQDDGFVLKLDTDGNFNWAIHIGGSGGGMSLALDSSRNVYTVGSFQGAVDFDPGVETYTLTSFGLVDIYVQKLDTDGNFVWAKQMGGTQLGFGTSLAVDPFGNVYTTGYFSGTLDFDPGPETFNIESFGFNKDAFIQKMDADGNFIWAKQIGGNWDHIILAIAVDSLGSVYTIGRFSDTTDFDPGPDTFILTPADGNDVFVHKLDTNGDFLWVKQMGGVYTDYVDLIAIDIDAAGSIYTTGYFGGTIDFDPGVGTVNLTSTGAYDAFIQKLDTEGNFLWVMQLRGTEFEGNRSYSIVVDAFANIYTTGSFSGTVDFDPGINTHNLTSFGGGDIFVLKLSQCYPTTLPIPYDAELSALIVMCELEAVDSPAPTALGDCERAVTAYPDPSFPITDQSITQIVWTYDDGHGNVTTQNQAINWTDMDVATSHDWLTITANNANGTYQWIDCDNNNAPISGENNQSFTASANGNYAVEITENGCVDTSECVSIISVGLDEFEQNLKMAVYPNPSSGIFNIAFEKPVDQAVLTITDINGKLISITNIQNTAKASLELNEAPGIYLLTIKSKDGQKTIQLIKE